MLKSLKKKYSVIKIKGRQYRVFEGEELVIDKIDPKKLKIDVLLYNKDSEVKIGKPNLTDIKVKFKVVGEEKGEKIKVFKYKAKSRYRKKMGFRPMFTKLLIEKVSA